MLPYRNLFQSSFNRDPFLDFLNFSCVLLNILYTVSNRLSVRVHNAKA